MIGELRFLADQTPHVLRGDVRYSIGRSLSSGALSEVYTVDADNEAEASRWVLKFDKDSAVAPSLARQEYETIHYLKEQFQRSHSESSRVLPDAELVILPDGRDGLILERMQPEDLLISRYRRQLEYMQSPLDVECDAWEIARKYCEFLNDLARAGRTEKDRKSGDFYYIQSSKRLVVLDWNVIELLSGAEEMTLQDARLLGRVWFNLFGGVDEVKFNLRSSQLRDISLIGRNLLLSLIDPALRDEHYGQYRLNAAYHLIGVITAIIRKLREPAERTESQLMKALTRTPLTTVPKDVEVEQYVLPVWELADLLQRKRPDSTVPELDQIQKLIKGSDHSESIKSEINYVQTALKEVERLKQVRRISPHGSALLRIWEYNIRNLQAEAARSGIDPKPYAAMNEAIAAVITNYLHLQFGEETALSDERQKLVSEIDALTQQYRQRLLEDQFPVGHPLNAQIEERVHILQLLRYMLEAEFALHDQGDLVLAKRLYESAADELHWLSESLQGAVNVILPLDPKSVADKLGAILKSPTYFDQIRQLIDESNYDNAFQRVAELQLRGDVPLTHLRLIESWLTPILWMKALSTSFTTGLRELAIMLEQAVWFVRSSNRKDWETELELATNKMSAQYLALTQSDPVRQVTPSEDQLSIICGNRLLVLYSALEAPKKDDP